MFAQQVTAEIALEGLEHRHAHDLFALTEENRAHLREWLPWLDRVRSVEDTHVFIDAALRLQREHSALQTVIRLAGAPVGIIGLHKIDWSTRSAALGYWLAARAQGKGVMTLCCAAHLQHAFTELGLELAEIRCAVKNTRSRAIPERLGFRITGIARDAEWLYDHYVDHVVYRLRARDWEGVSGARAAMGGTT